MSGIFEFIKKIWQTGETISAEKLNRMEDGIEHGINRAEEAVSAVNNLPISTDEEGFTEIRDLRLMTNGTIIRTGSVITATIELEGGKTSTSVISLDDNDYPIKIVTDGVQADLQWGGFDE